MGANDLKSAPHGAILGVERRATNLELGDPPVRGPRAAVQVVYFLTSQAQAA